MRLGLGGDTLDFDGLWSIVDDRDHVRGRNAEIDVKVNLLAVLYWLIAPPSKHRDFPFHAHAIGDYHRIPITGLDGNVPPTQLLEPALRPIHADPISNPEGAFQLQCQATHEITQRVLKRKHDYGCNHGRSRDNTGNRHARA